MIHTLAIKNYRSLLKLVAPLGRLNVIIGPNGSGKTTSFNLISGHLSPDEGRILFNGR